MKIKPHLSRYASFAFVCLFLAGLAPSALALTVIPLGAPNTNATISNTNHTINATDPVSASQPGFLASFNPTFTTGSGGATFDAGPVSLSANSGGTASVTYWIDFTVAEATTYSIAGTLSGFGGSGDVTLAYLTVQFLSVVNGVGTYVYGGAVTQYSYNPGNYALTLPSALSPYGYASGILGPGEYQFYYSAQLATNGPSLNGFGSASLIIGAGTSSAVSDESSTFALLGTVLLGWTAVRRKFGQV